MKQLLLAITLFTLTTCAWASSFGAAIHQYWGYAVPLLFGIGIAISVDRVIMLPIVIAATTSMSLHFYVVNLENTVISSFSVGKVSSVSNQSFGLHSGTEVKTNKGVFRVRGVFQPQIGSSLVIERRESELDYLCSKDIGHCVPVESPVAPIIQASSGNSLNTTNN